MLPNQIETISPPKVRAEQDQRIANEITESLQIVEGARDNPAIAAILSARGYDAAKLDEGLSLQADAQARFKGRQEAIGAQRMATATLAGSEAIARYTYMDFREVARALFTDRGERSKLAVGGRTPKDRQKFITTAKASYRAALEEPFASRFASSGYAAEEFQAGLANLDQLAVDDEIQDAAIGQAVQATADRDAAAATLRAWISQFKRLARVALKGNTDMLKALNLKSS
jgi:hypothetical protein